ncbi:hypothetical protein RB195_018489 [Necator americanus]|uniref:Uncharacterized protein n=1 Tax=Necator americanus TaxID=51031 RepID=A0ABR1CA13_NECAM
MQLTLGGPVGMLERGLMNTWQENDDKIKSSISSLVIYTRQYSFAGTLSDKCVLPAVPHPVEQHTYCCNLKVDQQRMVPISATKKWKFSQGRKNVNDAYSPLDFKINLFNI